MRPKRESHVYFLEAEGTDRVKIGVAYSVVNKRRQLQIGCPVKLKVLLVIPGDQYREQELHERFKEHRLHGEWFVLSPIYSEIMTLPLENLD